MFTGSWTRWGAAALVGAGCGGRVDEGTSRSMDAHDDELPHALRPCTGAPTVLPIHVQYPFWGTRSGNDLFLGGSQEHVVHVDLALNTLAPGPPEIPEMPWPHAGHASAAFLYVATRELTVQLFRWPLAGGEWDELSPEGGSWERAESLGGAEDTLVLLGTQGLFRVDTEAGGAAELISNAGSFMFNDHVLVDGDFAYWLRWIDAGIGQLLRVALGGGETETVAEHVTALLAQDSKYLYYANDAGESARVPKAGGNAEPVFEQSAAAAVSTEEGLYFVSHNETAATTGDLYVVPTTGSLPAVPQLVAEGGPFDEDDYEGNVILADEARIYWVAGEDLAGRASDNSGWALWSACRVREDAVPAR